MRLAILVLWAAGAAAADPMAQQRCVWSCLYNTGNDPANPAYDACVVQNCTEPVMSGGGADWTLAQLDPVDPPYLDGWVASIASPDSALRFRFACGKNGETSFTLSGSGLASPGPMAMDARTRLFVILGGTDGYVIDFSSYEGELVSEAYLDVLSSLQKGGPFDIRMPDGRVLGNFSGGNAYDAIGSAYAGCGLG